MSRAVETEVKREVRSCDDMQRFAAMLPAPSRRLLQLNLYLSFPGAGVFEESVRLRLVADAAAITGVDEFIVCDDVLAMVDILARLDAKAFLTSKSGRSRNGDVFAAMEVEQELPTGDAVAWLKGRSGVSIALDVEFGRLRNVFCGTSPVVETWSLTRRDVHLCEGGLRLELDETRYADGTRDFEVEVEDARIEAACRLLDDLGRAARVNLVAQIKSKHARAVAHSRRP